MNDIQNLYEFISLAEKNRKYPANTAHGKRAALKLFETVLHPDELESLALVESRIKEIFLSLISTYREKFNIQSLNTYKGRFLKLIQDYKRYGADPSALAKWEVKLRHYKNKDDQEDTVEDSDKDIKPSSISYPIHSSVYKIQIVLKNGSPFTIELPPGITKEDASIITKIIDSFTER